MQEPGAFLWWYAYLLNADGSGLVLIWSFGLPFLPGLRRAHEQGDDARPRSWPALNLAVYERGRPVFYALQRLRPEDALWDGGDHWTFGDTTFALVRDFGAVRLTAEVDITLPGGERATGVVEVEGVGRRPDEGERAPAGLPAHDWSPLTGPARGHARLRFSDQDFEVRGRADHDRNGGKVPLWDLDIRRWLWGRVPFAHEEMIFFTLWRKDAALPAETLLLFLGEVGRTRQADDVTLQLQTDALSWTGLRVPRSFELSWRGGAVVLKQRSLVDLGPFYVRMTAEASREGERALGYVEGLVPSRVDGPWQRPFVRMRVHEAAGNSSFLPLFCGRSDGRLGRYCRSLWRLGRATEAGGA